LLHRFFFRVEMFDHKINQGIQGRSNGTSITAFHRIVQRIQQIKQMLMLFVGDTPSGTVLCFRPGNQSHLVPPSHG